MQLSASKCYYHPERGAVATCAKCGAGVCQNCAVKDGPGRIVCLECANEELRQKHKDYRKWLKKRGGRFRTGKDFVVPGIIGILIVIAFEILLIYIGYKENYYDIYFSDDASSLVGLILAHIILAYWLFSLPFCYLVLKDLIPIYHSTTVLEPVNTFKSCFKVLVMIFLGWFVFTVLWLRFVISKIMASKRKT